MVAITSKSGKCSNFGNCSLADSRATVEVPSGLDFVCTECGKPVRCSPTVARKAANRKRASLAHCCSPRF